MAICGDALLDGTLRLQRDARATDGRANRQGIGKKALSRHQLVHARGCAQVIAAASAWHEKTSSSVADVSPRYIAASHMHVSFFFVLPTAQVYCALMSFFPWTGVRSAYFAATLNWLDLPAFAMATTSLVLGFRATHVGDGAAAVASSSAASSYDIALAVETVDVYYTTRIARAAGLMLLALRQLKVLLNLPMTGPLVMMIIRMFGVTTDALVSERRPCRPFLSHTL